MTRQKQILKGFKLFIHPRDFRENVFKKLGVQRGGRKFPFGFFKGHNKIKWPNIVNRDKETRAIDLENFIKNIAVQEDSFS